MGTRKDHCVIDSENKCTKKKVTFTVSEDRQNDCQNLSGSRTFDTRTSVKANDKKSAQQQSCAKVKPKMNSMMKSQDNTYKTQETTKYQGRSRYYRSNITVYDGLTHQELFFL